MLNEFLAFGDTEGIFLCIKIIIAVMTLHKAFTMFIF